MAARRFNVRITFQRDMPLRSKRKLHAIGGGRGMWSLNIRKPSTPLGADNDSIIISTDANPSPGLSRVCTTSMALSSIF